MKQIAIDQVYYSMLVNIAKKMKKTPAKSLEEILVNEYNKTK